MATVAKSSRSTTITLASATAGPFDLDFRLFDSDTLDVFVNYLPRTDWTLNATFVDGFTDSAAITFDAALADGDVIVVNGELFPNRSQDYLNSGGLIGKLNIELARLWSAASEQYRNNRRSLRFFQSVSPVALEANKVIVGNATGDGLAMGPTVDEINDAKTYAERAEAAAASVIGPFTSFGAFETWVASNTASQGVVADVDGVSFISSPGATALPRTPDWLPFGTVTPLHFGDQGDGVTNSDAVFAAIDAYVSGGVVDLRGKSYVATALPYPNTPDATDPIYVNGAFVVGGVTYKAASMAGIISALDETEEQNTAHRVALVASDRSRAGGSSGRQPAAAVASSRVQVEGNRAAAVATTQVDILGSFNNMATACRESQIFGEQGFLAGSRLTRIWGTDGVADDGNLWGKSGAATFDPAHLDPTSGSQTFRNTAVTCLGVDITSGSDNFVAASRGQTDLSSGVGKVDYALQVGGSRMAVLATQGSGSVTSVVEGDGIFVGASFSPTVNDGASYSAMLAARDSTLEATCDMALIAASGGAVLNGDAQAIIASTEAEVVPAGTSQSAIIASSGTGGSTITNAAANRSVILSSRNIENATSDSLAMGYTAATLTPSGTNQNQSIRLEANGGIGRFSGGTSTTGLDYAEFFKNAEGKAIDPGYVMVRVAGSRAVRRGKDGDDPSMIVGVVSATPSVIGNAGDFEWHGRYEVDEFGRRVMADTEMVKWDSDDGKRPEFEGRVDQLKNVLGIARDECPDDAAFYTEPAPVQSEVYDPTQTYVPRSERPDDYTLVGMVGQVITRVGDDVEADDFIGPDGARSLTPTKIIAMEFTGQSIDGKRLAWCLVG